MCGPSPVLRRVCEHLDKAPVLHGVGVRVPTPGSGQGDPV